MFLEDHPVGLVESPIRRGRATWSRRTSRDHWSHHHPSRIDFSGGTLRTAIVCAYYDGHEAHRGDQRHRRTRQPHMRWTEASTPYEEGGGSAQRRTSSGVSQQAAIPTRRSAYDHPAHFPGLRPDDRYRRDPLNR